MALALIQPCGLHGPGHQLQGGGGGPLWAEAPVESPGAHAWWRFLSRSCRDRVRRAPGTPSGAQTVFSLNPAQVNVFSEPKSLSGPSERLP